MPIWLPTAALVDVITAPKRMRFCRIGFVVLLLAINEISTLIFLGFLWVRTGFGFRVWSDTGQERMQRSLRHYALGLVRCTKQALGVRQLGILGGGLGQLAAAGQHLHGRAEAPAQTAG